MIFFQGRTTTYLQNPWLGSNKSPVVKGSSVTTSTSCSTTSNKPNVIKGDEKKQQTTKIFKGTMRAHHLQS